MKIDDSRCNIRGQAGLADLGLYSMLAGLLSDPAFGSPSGGMHHILLSHASNRYYSLHGAWKRLTSSGLLQRTRIPDGTNRFRDYYALGTDYSAEYKNCPARCLTVAEAETFLSERKPYQAPASGFVAAPKSMLADPALSIDAKGLYVWISRFLAMAKKGIAVTKETIRAQLGVGRTAFARLWRELRDHGYLVLTRGFDRVLGHTAFDYKLTAGGSSPISAAAERKTIRRAARAVVEKVRAGKNPKAAEKAAEPDDVQDVREQISADIWDTDNTVAPEVGEAVGIMAGIRKEAREHPEKVYRISGDEIAARDVDAHLRSMREDDFREALLAFIDMKSKGKLHNARRYLLSCLYNAVGFTADAEASANQMLNDLFKMYGK